MAILLVNLGLFTLFGALMWQGRSRPSFALLALLVMAGTVMLLPDRETASGNETNRFVRYATVESWVRYGEWSIEDVMAREERGDTLDLSFKDGRPYSQKPPGISWAAIPIYWVMTKVYPGGRPPTHWTISILSLLTIFLPVMVVSYFLGNWLVGKYGSSAGMLGVAVLLLASPMCLYSMMFLGYARPTMLLVGAYIMLRTGESRGRYFWAALLLGWAGVDNPIFWAYGASVAGIELIRRITEGREWRRYLGWGLLGVSIPGIALVAYNWTVWGGPFTTAYNSAFLNKAHIANHAGVGWDWGMLYQGLFGARWGIMFHAPWAALGVAGILSMLSSRDNRWEGVTALVMFIAPLAFTAFWLRTNIDDYPFNRHMLPAFPWLCWGLAHLVSSAQEWSLLTRKAVLGAVAGTLFVATFYQWVTLWIVPFHPNELPSPLWQFSIPLFVSGTRMPLLDLASVRTPGLENLGVAYVWTWIHAGYILLAYAAAVAWTRHPDRGGAR